MDRDVKPVSKCVGTKPKTNMALKFGLGKRKSSGDGDGNSKAAKTESESSSARKPEIKPIKMALSGQKTKEPTTVLPPAKKPMSVAAAFGDDSDSEPEEMPAEAKMRMKNVGRDTPTAAGPNSFGKSRLGFCDTQRTHERLMKEIAEKVD